MTYSYYPKSGKLIVPTFNTLEIIDMVDVVFVMAHESCSKVYLSDGRSFTCTYPFAELVTMLDETFFYRSHKSYMINLLHILRYHRNGHVELTGNELTPLARRRKDEFVLRMQQYFNADRPQQLRTA